MSQSENQSLRQENAHPIEQAPSIQPMGIPPSGAVESAGQVPSQVGSQAQAQQPLQPIVNVTQSVSQNVSQNVIIQGRQTGLFTRAIYFVFIGWWLGSIWASIGWFLAVTIVLMPIGLMMLNSLPKVMTLKDRGTGITVRAIQR